MGHNPEADAKTAKKKPSKKSSKPRQNVDVEIICERWGSNKSESVKVIEAPMVTDNAVRIDITLDLRNTGQIIIRPIRRDMDDVDGMIADAERLANED